MTKYPYIISLILLLIGSDMLGQSYSAKIRKLSIEEGLSNRFVSCAFQDSKGFIWLGTNYGLNRYDGYSFKLFTKENEGLSSNIIHNIYEDGDTCLWITYLEAVGGKRLERIDILNLNTLKVETLQSKFGQKLPFAQNKIFEIYQGNKQNIVIVTKDRKVFEYAEDGSFVDLFLMPHPTYTLHEILLTEKRIWLIGAGYLLEYDRAGLLLKSEVVPFKSIMDLHQESGSFLGYARDYSDSLVLFSKKINEPIDYQVFSLFNKGNETINSETLAKQFPNGLIWYSNKGEARVYSSKRELVYDFSDHLLQETIHKVNNIIFDNNNSTWIATSNGVYVLTIELNRFQKYLNKDDFSPNNKAFSTRAMAEDDNGFLYVNTYSGRQRINIKTGEVMPVLEGKKLPDLDAMRDKEGNIWFCGELDYVQCFSPKLNTYKSIPCVSLYSKVDFNYNVMNIKLFQDSYNRIWMGTNDGVYYLDTVHQAFIKYNAYGLCTKLNTSRVYSFVEDTLEQVLWVGGSKGVYKYDYVQGQFTLEYATNREPPFYIPHSSIITIHKDASADCYWLGSDGGGLIKWMPKSGDYEQFTIATGLSDNVIYGILEDDEDFLWLSSNYGLMRFDKKTKLSHIYLPTDGITSEEFNTLSCYKSSSGRFYFGGLNGIIAFYPRDFQKEERTSLPLHILSYHYLKGNAEKLEDRTSLLAKTKSIVLKPRDNFVQLTFSLLDFRDPDRNKYSYIIEGAGQGWQYINENVVRINRLPYGSYTLRVRGQSSDGKWSVNELVIPIEVQVPFYKTVAFMIFAAIFFGIIVLIGARMAIRRSEKNKEYLEKEITNRTQTLLEREQDLLHAKEEAEKSSLAKAEFLSVMSHEIRTPMNAVVNLTNYLLEENPTADQIEQLNILKFSANNLLAIINDVLDFSKIESGKIALESIGFDLLDLLESIHYGMSVNAKKKNILFFLDADISLKQLLIGDPNRLVQILNNLIGNAIKFTENGTVKLLLTILQETDTNIEIKFEVEDTGIGIDEDEMNYIFNMFTQAASDTTRKYGGTGLGLAITKRLLQLQNSQINLSSTVGKGSNFSFVLFFDKGRDLHSKQTLGSSIEDLEMDLKGISVLVVEDNAVNVLVVKKFLKKWGVKTTHAVDGQVALTEVKNIEFDLILMDIHMPNMDGYTATKAIRSMGNKHYEQIPIIALTASALMDNRGRVYEAGMNDIVVKPFNPKELYNMIARHIIKSSN